MDKQLGRLGLAKRAGRLAIGFDPALKAVKDGSAVLILLAEDLSEKTLKEWRFAAERYAVPEQTEPYTKEELGGALGAYRAVGLIAVCDEGFAAAMHRTAHTQEEE